MRMKLVALVAAPVLFAGALLAPPSALPASAAVISCANVDPPVPLNSKIPGATITGYRFDREIDTDFYPDCTGSEDSTYILTLQLRNATQATLSTAKVECKVYSARGLLMDRMNFTLTFPAKLDPGDSGRTTASAALTHGAGERLDCVLDSAT